MGWVRFLFHPRGASHRIMHCFRIRHVSSEPATMLGVISPWVLIFLGFLAATRLVQEVREFQMKVGDGILLLEP